MRALTARQRQVLLLAARGLTNARIARRTGIASTTVQRHLAVAYQELGANDRAHAVALAIHYGVITLAELAAIAGASSLQAVEGPREDSGTPQSAQEAVDGAPDVRGAARPSGGRAAARGEAAA
jgi:DNA-binding CsgD family transcriptional regulator